MSGYESVRLHLQDKATPCGRCREDSKKDNLLEGRVDGCMCELIGVDFLSDQSMPS